MAILRKIMISHDKPMVFFSQTNPYDSIEVYKDVWNIVCPKMKDLHGMCRQICRGLTSVGLADMPGAGNRSSSVTCSAS